LAARTRTDDRQVEIVRVLHSASVPEDRHLRQVRRLWPPPLAVQLELAA
jgi:hypothetical protein